MRHILTGIAKRYVYYNKFIWWVIITLTLRLHKQPHYI